MVRSRRVSGSILTVRRGRDIQNYIMYR